MMQTKLTSAIEFDKYDIVHVGISGGKDSQAALAWLRFDSGCPVEKIRASFCDTGNEHDWTYEHIDYMRRAVAPVAIETLKTELNFYELAEKKGRFPSAKARFCTEYLKMQSSQKHVLEWMIADLSVLLITGVRHAESKDREALPQFEFDTYYACDIYRPLIDWTTNDVFAYLEANGQHANPLYSIGAKRVGCLPCVMSRKSEMRLIADNFPERIEKIAEYEDKIGSSFFHMKSVPERFRNSVFFLERR